MVRTRRVASRIREALLGDPVDGEADAWRHPKEVSLDTELDRETSGLCLIDQRGNLDDGRKRRRHACLVVAAEERHRAGSRAGRP